MCSNSHEMEQDPNVTATFTELDYQTLNPVLKRCAHDCTGDISSLSNGIDEVRFYSPQAQSRI